MVSWIHRIASTGIWCRIPETCSDVNCRPNPSFTHVSRWLSKPRDSVRKYLSPKPFSHSASYSGLDDLSHQLHSRQSSFLSHVNLTLLGLLCKPPCWSCRRWASGLCHLERKGRHWNLNFSRPQSNALLHSPHFRDVREARYLLPRPLLCALAGRVPARTCCECIHVCTFHCVHGCASYVCVLLEWVGFALHGLVQLPCERILYLDRWSGTMQHGIGIHMSGQHALKTLLGRVDVALLGAGHELSALLGVFA